MPTCHYLCCNQPQEEESPKWKPIGISINICQNSVVITSEGCSIYQNCRTNFKICNDCYGCMMDEQKDNYAIIFSHHLIHRESVYNQMNYTGCSKTIIQVKPAEECLGCMKKFQHVDQMLFNLEWGITVVTAWV